MVICRVMLILTLLALVYCIVLVVAMFPCPFFVAIVALCVLAAKRNYREYSACGTARWADARDLQRAGMLGSGRGLILGRMAFPKVVRFEGLLSLFDPKTPSHAACEKFFSHFQKPQPYELLVRLSNAVHVAVFAPTGVGKGVSCVIPHLLTCPDSMVVVDFKGENAKLTAEFRREKFGHRVILLDPFKSVTLQPDYFNPLDFIARESLLAIDECRDLAEALIVRTGQEKEPHWVDSAEAWIAAMIAVVVEYGVANDRSLQTVRTLLSNPQKLEAVIQLMCGSDAWGGMLSRLGQQLTHFKDKELASTLTTTNRFLRFLDTLAVMENTKTSSFDPAELRQGKMTVYLVLPPEHMRALAPLLRMWIGALMRAIVRGGLQETNKVHFVLDEAASLGRMDALDDAVDKFRGYGIRLQFYYQSLGQLKKCFPEGQDQTLLSNTTQVFFGVNDQQTAEYVSARLGETTIVVDSGGTSSGDTRQSNDHDGNGSRSYSRNNNQNWQQQARKLLKPEEVLALPERIAITFTPGIPPLWTRLTRYFEKQDCDIERADVHRFWPKFKIVAASALCLACALFFACGLTGRAIERRLFSSSGPSGSVQRGWEKAR